MQPLMSSVQRPPLRQALRTGLRLRCPYCGLGDLFGGWFRMLRQCPICGLEYFRESGYFIGAMIINYGVTAALVTSLYLLSRLLPEFTPLSFNAKLALWMLFAVGVSLAFMRHSYSFWLALDFWLEPWEPKESAPHPSDRS